MELQQYLKTTKRKKLYCTYCQKEAQKVIWRYVQPVDDYAEWSETGQDYVYVESADKGHLDCERLCGTCTAKLTPFIT